MQRTIPNNVLEAVAAHMEAGVCFQLTAGLDQIYTCRVFTSIDPVGRITAEGEDILDVLTQSITSLAIKRLA